MPARADRRSKILNEAYEKGLLSKTNVGQFGTTETATFGIPKTNLFLVHVNSDSHDVACTFLKVNKPSGFKTEVAQKDDHFIGRSPNIKVEVSLDYFIDNIPDLRLKGVFLANMDLFHPAEIEYNE